MPLFHDKWVFSFMEIQILAPKFRAFWPLTATQFGYVYQAARARPKPVSLNKAKLFSSQLHTTIKIKRRSKCRSARSFHSETPICKCLCVSIFNMLLFWEGSVLFIKVINFSLQILNRIVEMTLWQNKQESSRFDENIIYSQHSARSM